MDIDEPEEDLIAMKIFYKIATLDIHAPTWRKDAILIRIQMEGRELSVINAIQKHGELFIHALGLKILMDEKAFTYSLREADLVRKLSFIFHPDKWHNDHSSAVFGAIQEWAEYAKTSLEGYTDHIEKHRAMLRELKKCFENNDHIRKAEQFIKTNRRM